MNFTVNRAVVGHLSLLLPVLALVSLLLPVTGEGQLPASMYLGIQLSLVFAGMVLAVAAGKLDGKPLRIALADLRVQAGVFLMLGAGVQFGVHRWPLVPLVLFLFFPLTDFACRRSVLWLPALVPAVAAAGRYAFLREMEMALWAAAFLAYSVILGFRMSRDQRTILSSRSQFNRMKSDAEDVMKRVQQDDRGKTLDRIRGEEAAAAAALDEDDLLQKLLILGCRFFGARTGILLVPAETGYYRMRAAVHRGVKIVEELVPSDKGFIHIAVQRGGVLCVSDARSAGRSLGLYSDKTEVGSFLVKVLYDKDWAQDAGDGEGQGKIRCVLYFDSETVNKLSLDAVTSKRLEEFGALVFKAMRTAGLLHRMTTDMSVKDAIARYARNLTRSLKPEDLAEEALKAMLEALPECSGAAVLLYDDEDRALSVAASSGELVGGLKDAKIFRDEPSQMGLLLRRFAEMGSGPNPNGSSQAEILIHYKQARKSPFFLRGEKLDRITSFAAIPCYMGKEDGKTSLKAAIAAVSRKADVFRREEVEDLRTLAGMMAPALDNALQHRKVDNLSRTDGLTGLLNHRTFQIILDGKINSMSRYGQSMAVLMVDADKFKTVNDTYGHPVGDEVLVELAARLKALVRKNDAVARYGGEEFTVVLDSVDEHNARSIAEKMREAIASRPFATAAGQLSVTASFGFSVLRKDDTTTKREFLGRADQALYHAKESGRNRVVSYMEIEGAAARRNPYTGAEEAEVAGEVRS
ncbi:MAG: GGDEF domain-containing protein [bacterium]|nr:GGDEF domain-containing protein [bacterium]MDT8395851.1 GGDEF domain-containing protein [bacterium]